MSEHTASPDGRVRISVLGTLHLERRMADGRWEDVPATSEEWGTGHPTRSFLRYLLAHGRCVGRSTILDTLWTDVDSADRYLYNAASTLRRILRSDEQAPLLETVYNRTTYKLADQSRVWVDVDHATSLLQEVKRSGPTSERGLRLLQEAELLFRRGPLFADEPGDWCFGLREQTRTMQYRCQLWLAEAYEAHQQLAEAEIVVEALLTQDPTDEQALRHLMTLLHKQGLTSEAMRRYKQTALFLKQKGLALSAETDEHVQTMLYRPLMRPASTEHVVPSSSGTLSPVPEQSLLPSRPPTRQGILGAMHMPEREDMDMLRRQLLQQLLTLGGAVVTSRDMFDLAGNLDTLKEHFVSNTSPLILYEYLLSLCWGLYYAGNSQSLLSLIDYCLHSLVTAFKEAHGPEQLPLLTLLSRFYQLSGVLARDRMDITRALSDGKKAIELSFHTENGELIAASFFRRAKTYTKQKEYTKAVQDLDVALLYAHRSRDPLKGYIHQAAAEVYALTAVEDQQSQKKCLSLLDTVENILVHGNLEDDGSFVKVNAAGLSIDRAGVLTRFQKSQEARQTLVMARQHLGSDLARWQSRLFIADAETYFAEHDPQSCCTTLFEALKIVRATGSRSSETRIVGLYQQLNAFYPRHVLVMQLGEQLHAR